MTWTAFHRRAEILRTVTSTADARRDGLLPMDVGGVREAFHDELALLAALQLRWHTRLSGHLEHALLDGPTDPDAVVVRAWLETAAELPGLRLILDHYRAHPLHHAISAALRTAEAKEHVLLAASSGRSSSDVMATIGAGRALEHRARARCRAAA